MTIASLIDTPSELTDAASSKTAIVLMTRVRLARNLAGNSFPGWAKPAQREEVLAACREAVAATAPMKRSLSINVDELSELEKQILVERHLISRELSGAKAGAGVVIASRSCARVSSSRRPGRRSTSWIPRWRTGSTTPSHRPSAT